MPTAKDQVFDRDGRVVEERERVLPESRRAEAVARLQAASTAAELKAWLRDHLLPRLRFEDE